MKRNNVNKSEAEKMADEIWTLQKFTEWQKSSGIIRMVAAIVKHNGYYTFLKEDGKKIFVTN